MIKPEHTKDGKILEEHKSKYKAREIEEYELKQKPDRELLEEIYKDIKDLKRCYKRK